MPIEISNDDVDQFMTVHMSGSLSRTDYDHFVPEFEKLVRHHGKLHVLFDMVGFNGFETSAIWEEIKFDAKHLGDIERCAIVGDKKWHHVMTAICIPFTKAKIQYFDQTNSSGARNWLVHE